MDIEPKGKKRRREVQRNTLSQKRNRSEDENLSKRKKLEEAEDTEKENEKLEELEGYGSKKDQEANEQEDEGQKILKKPEKEGGEAGEERNMYHNEGRRITQVKLTNEKTEIEEERTKSNGEGALWEVVKRLHKEMDVLNGRMKEITKENRELKAWARAIGTKIRKMGENEEQDSLLEYIAEMEEVGSPTPVSNYNAENINQPVEDFNKEKDNQFYEARERVNNKGYEQGKKLWERE